jgi:hypothetical protein
MQDIVDSHPTSSFAWSSLVVVFGLGGTSLADPSFFVHWRK